MQLEAEPSNEDGSAGHAGPDLLGKPDLAPRPPPPRPTPDSSSAGPASQKAPAVLSEALQKQQPKDAQEMESNRVWEGLAEEDTQDASPPLLVRTEEAATQASASLQQGEPSSQTPSTGVKQGNQAGAVQTSEAEDIPLHESLPPTASESNSAVSRQLEEGDKAPASASSKQQSEIAQVGVSSAGSVSQDAQLGIDNQSQAAEKKPDLPVPNLQRPPATPQRPRQPSSGPLTKQRDIKRPRREAAVASGNSLANQDLDEEAQLQIPTADDEADLDTPSPSIPETVTDARAEASRQLESSTEEPKQSPASPLSKPLLSKPVLRPPSSNRLSLADDALWP